MIDRVAIQKTTNITAFLGAGASAPFGFPTTKTFLEKFRVELGPSDKQWAYFNSLRNLYWVEDIENVVGILDSILKMENDSDSSSLGDFFHRYPRSVEFGKRTDRTVYTPVLEGQKQWNELVELSSTLRDSIEGFVFKQYESNADERARSVIKNVMGGFFSVLKKHSSGKHAFEVFTTNYDNVVEDYCSEAGYTCSLSEVNHELEPKVGKLSEEKIVLIKLHGALNWLVNKQTKEIRVIEAQIRVPRDSKSWDTNEYVLFGTKTRLNEAGVYDRLFKRLEKCLNSTNICVVVGFRFRDKDINDVFRRALESNKTLRILVVSNSATSSLRSLITNRREFDSLKKDRRIFPLKCRFGTNRTIPKIDNALSSI